MISVCACLGPIKGEPMCPCQMKDAGLRTAKDYELSDDEKSRLNKALADVFARPNAEMMFERYEGN